MKAFNSNAGLLLSTIFTQIFIFLPNDSPSKTIKNNLYFIEKALFILKYSIFKNFFPFPHFPDLKEQMEVEWFMCHELACINLEIQFLE